MKAEHDYWGDSRNRYIQYLEEKRERDALSVITNAERRGEARGIAKGEARGIKKGIAEGKFDMARNLLKAGVSPEVIAGSSGLSINEILALRD
jgi:predicted transposase/invertase (TIGR01784 family)